MNGLYWLNYISNVFGLSEIESITNSKMKEISDFSLSSVSYFNKYGIVFDVPMACIEILFNIKEIEDIILKAKNKSGKGKPIVIIMNTTMGNGVDYMMGTHKWHGVAPNDEELKIALDQNAETLKDY